MCHALILLRSTRPLSQALIFILMDRNFKLNRTLALVVIVIRNTENICRRIKEPTNGSTGDLIQTQAVRGLQNFFFFVRIEKRRICSASPALPHQGIRCFSRVPGSLISALQEKRRQVPGPVPGQGICRPDQLATIAEETDVIGYVTAKAAAETGLAEGTPVTPGGDDSACEAISCGIGKMGDLILQFGSTIYMFLLCDHLVMDPRVWHEEFIIPGTCDVSGATNTAGSMTKWLRDTLFQDLLAAEKAGGENAFSVMARMAAEVPVGSNGLVCLPYFAGERTPIDDPNARGAFLGLTINHTREDMLRAGLEGVAYSINQHFKIFEEDGIPIGRVLVAGGGTKNDAWMQIVADVTGKTLFVPEITIGASYGDAMMAAIAAGYWADFDELASKVKIAKTFEPCAENHEAYKKFQAIFDELYPATKELAHQL